MLNKVELIGRVGNDPEVRQLDGGQKVASFSLATSEKYTDKSGVKQEKTEWHSCKCWGKTSDIVEKYIKKGALLFIEGKITYGKYTNKDGNEVKTTDIMVNNVQMLDSRKSNEAQEQPTPNATPAPFNNSESDPGNDLPF